MNRKVVVIGAGLGGLQCAWILAKNGMDVTVLEKGKAIGGCLQSFRRGNVIFDTGMHYVGSLGEGESLNSLFRYFGLMKLPWRQLDRECFDEVIIGGESYPIPNGHDEFVRTLADRFPKSKDNLRRYAGFLKSVGDGIFDGLRPGESVMPEATMFGKSAWDYLKETLEVPSLIDVVSGMSMKMELRKETLPLYTFAQINDSFIRSAWRLQGGGSLIAKSLRDDIVRMGGRVLTGMEVTEILEDEHGVRGVRTASDEEFHADRVISSLHPALTVALAPEDGHMRKAFRHRIARLGNTFGMFTANIKLKNDAFRYLDRNVYMYRDSPWNLDTRDTSAVMVSFPVPESGEYAVSVDLLSPMSWDGVSGWKDTAVGHRGGDYAALKDMKYRQCMEMVENRFPELWEAVDKVYTSTPATWSAYTGAPEGDAYGIRKDFAAPATTVLSPKTPVPGLLMTGQCLNLHGILGVSMTSLYTCAEILGKDKIYDEIKPYIK